MKHLSQKQEIPQEMIDDARRLYLKYGGSQIRRIEEEMQELGWPFRRHMLYARRTPGGVVAGWAERFGWRAMLDGGDQAASPTRGGGRNRFEKWLCETTPNFTWNWPYQRYIYERLWQVTSGTNRRLMLFMPPRHGKSEMVTVRYTAWRLLEDPKLNVIIGSYNQQLANRFSRRVKRIVRSAEEENRKNKGSAGKRVRVPLNSAAEWETAGGGIVRAVGAGAGIAGFGARLIVIDDPVKNRAEAESQTYRDRVWQWFNDDIYTRMEPDAAIILIQTRWHEDDLAGRLILEAREAGDGGEKWDIVSLPALAEPPVVMSPAAAGTAAAAHTLPIGAGPPVRKRFKTYEVNGYRRIIHTLGAPRPGFEYIDDPAYKAAQAAKAEARREARRRKRLGLPPAPPPEPEPAVIRETEAEFAKPVDPNWRDPIGRREGEALCPKLFPVSSLLKYKKKLGTYSFAALYQQRPVPAEGGRFKRAWFRKIIDAPPPGLKWKRGYDLAISTRTSADYTASFRCARDAAGYLYIADGFRSRIEYPEQRRYIIERMSAEPDTEHGIEDAGHGRAVVQDLRGIRSLSHRPLRSIRVESDKLTRALAWLNLAEEGRIYLVRGPWIDEFVDEVCSFPAGRHDDQIDAVSLAVRMIADNVGKRTAWGF